MNGLALPNIHTAVVEEIDPHLIGRIIGKGGETLRRMKTETECRIVVADNGRMWIDGELDGILDVRNRLSAISRESRGGRN